MIVGVNILVTLIGIYHGFLVILGLNSFITFIFPALTVNFGYYGAMIGRLMLGCAHGPMVRHLKFYFFSFYMVIFKNLYLLMAILNRTDGI